MSEQQQPTCGSCKCLSLMSSRTLREGRCYNTFSPHYLEYRLIGETCKEHQPKERDDE